MDKSIKLAVAGSGKTSYLVNNLNEVDKTLIITYTHNNHASILERVEERFNKVPDNIEVQTFFTFLYSFCFSPFLLEEIDAKGIYWDFPPNHTRFFPRDDDDDLRFYRSKEKLLYHNRISKLLLTKKVTKRIINRLEKYYSKLYIDEVQDIGGHDFNLIMNLMKAEIEIKLVGDFFQHTYSTSYDGNINKTLHDDLKTFIKKFEKKNIKVVTDDLNKSWRCAPKICQFIKENLGIEIYSHTDKKFDMVYLEEKEQIQKIFDDNDIIKLFYQKSDSYKCYAKNWGDCKGENHHNDVCVVLNKKATSYFKKNKLYKLPSRSRNKLYVACSRPNQNLYLVSQETLDKTIN